MRRTITKQQNILLAKLDGVEKGGVEIPVVKDADRSVILVFKPGATETTGLHWHEQKTGESPNSFICGSRAWK